MRLKLHLLLIKSLTKSSQNWNRRFHKNIIPATFSTSSTMYGKYLENDYEFATKSIHDGYDAADDQHGSLVLPIVLATTFKQEFLPQHKQGYMYARLDTPTRNSFEKSLASLEGLKHCLAFSSGQAAAATVLNLFKPADHIITQTDSYHGVFNLMKFTSQKGLNVDFVDVFEAKNIEKFLTKETKLVWLETPTNPLMKLVDLKQIVDIVRSRSPDTLIACDNTFMSPYFQRPANFGVDIVMHSCTKYIGGHSDILMGALCLDDDTLWHKLKKLQVRYGSIPSPFECYLAHRSLKTLEVRMEKHMKNSIAIATLLESHPAVETVFHPGLPSHPDHKLSLRQCYGHSGMFSFYLKGHKLDTTKKVLESFKMVTLADSLGGVETTVKIPSHMPPGSLTAEEMTAQGITDGLFRVSTGIESTKSLLDDFKQALDAAL